VNRFAEFCLTTAEGHELRQSAFHVAMHAFLDAHRHALIELPRDHGKSVQACIRVLWELGRDPSLRVKIVCATEERAIERVRFLRKAIAENPRVGFGFRS
jgi:hypothetical protein